MKRTRFLAAMLGIGLVFGGCAQTTGGGGKSGTPASTAYTSADGISTRLVLTEILPAVVTEVQSSGNESGAAYSVSAPKIGEAFNYELYRSDALISSGKVTINSAVSWIFTSSTGGFTFSASYSGETLAFSDKINDAVSGPDIMPVIGVPAPIAPEYGISLSESGDYEFEATIVGEAVPEALKVTITNMGDSATGDLTVTLGGDDASSFTVTQPSPSSITATNGMADFTVAPIAELAELDARDTPYTATVTVSGGNGISASFNVSFTVIDPAYGISLDAPGNYPFVATIVDEDYTVPDALTVKISNTGNRATGNLNVALTGNGKGYFTLSTETINSIAVSGMAEFTVGPKPERPPVGGPYTATVTVSGGNGISAGFGVSFTVNSVAPSYSIGLSETETLIFDDAIFGYLAQPAKNVTITNTGNRPTGELTVSVGADFDVARASDNDYASSIIISSISTSGSFKVRPKTGLGGGIHDAKVTVSAASGNITGIESKSFDVSFYVIAATYGISLKKEDGTTLSSASPLTFPEADENYEELPAKNVTITNTGNRPTGNLTVSVGADFDVARASDNNYASSIIISSISTSGSFKVRPKTGLGGGIHNATVTVSAADGNTTGIASKSFTVSFYVIPATYGISLKKEDGTTLSSASPLTFPAAPAGYGEQTGTSVTVTNEGNRPTGYLTVSVDTDFDVARASDNNYASSIIISSISISTSGSFKVRPKTGLGGESITQQ